MGTHACAPHAATAAGSSPTLRTARALHAQGLNSLTSAHTPVTTMPAYDIIFVDARGTKKRGSGGMRPRGVTCICRVLLAQLQHQRQKQPAPHTDQKVTTDGCNVQLQKLRDGQAVRSPTSRDLRIVGTGAAGATGRNSGRGGVLKPGRG